MANLKKVMLIGRLTKDPEVRTFSNGGKVANIRFAVNNRVKNQQTGQWEDKPVYLDVKAFNREPGRKLADLVETYLKRGHQAYIEGHLVLDEWDDKDTGQKRSVLRVVLEDLQFLEPKADGGNAEGGARQSKPSQAPARAAVARPAGNGGEQYDEPEAAPSGQGDEEIPF
jgi:single-strand DNA-binding protein